MESARDGDWQQQEWVLQPGVGLFVRQEKQQRWRASLMGLLRWKSLLQSVLSWRAAWDVLSWRSAWEKLKPQGTFY